MPNKPKTSQKWILIVGGTALTLLAAGVLYQVSRPQTTQAGRQQKTKRPSQKQSQTASRKKPMARVNGKLISYDQLAEECVSRYGQSVLAGLINRSLVEQAFVDRVDAPTAEDVDRYIIETAKKFNLTPGQWMQMMQNQEEGMTPEQYRRDVIWPMLALRRLAGSSIDISKGEMQEAFERNYGKRVRAKVIVFDRLRQAEEVWEELARNPDDFERLAMKHSIDRSSRALGGSVPPIRRHTGNKPVEDAAFKLQEGEISGVIQIPDNGHFVIIKSEGHTQPVEVDYADVKAMLEDELREEKVRSLAHRTFDTLKVDSRIDNYLTGETTGSNKKNASRRDSRVKQVSGTGQQRQQPKRRSQKR